MAVTAALVKELRERTGAGMLDCKNALVEANADIELAIENMRKSGQAKAAKKAGRIAAEGVILTKISGGKATMMEVNCETDFVARDENISPRRVVNVEGANLGAYVHGGKIGVIVILEGGDEDLAKDIAMHVAAASPQFVKPSDVSPEVVEKEKEIQIDIAIQSGKKPEIAEKMVAGRMKKFTGEISLTGQNFIKDPSMTVEDLLKSKNADVVNFIRFEVGEGIEKKTEDFAAEVAAQYLEAGSLSANKSVIRQDAECQALHGWARSDFYLQKGCRFLGRIWLLFTRNNKLCQQPKTLHK